jgi:hypothetical protein
MADPNYSRIGEFLPIATLSPSYSGPVILANDDLTVQWFSKKQSKAAIDHFEHERDESSEFVFDGVHKDGSQKPKLRTGKVKPAFWAMARIVD